MKRYIESTSETIPEELSSRPYVFILNSVNSTYNDDILEIAEKWGAIKVKYQQKIADTDKLYREGYWCFAVDEKATAQHIWDEVKAMKIPTHQDSLNIVKTNWNDNYNIWIDDYAKGTYKVKWHENYPVKSSTDVKASEKLTSIDDNTLSMATTLYEMCEDMDRQDFEDTKQEEIGHIAEAIDQVKQLAQRDTSFAALYNVLDTLSYIGG